MPDVRRAEPRLEIDAMLRRNAGYLLGRDVANARRLREQVLDLANACTPIADHASQARLGRASNEGFRHDDPPRAMSARSVRAPRK
jgi:hypothetical protein